MKEEKFYNTDIQEQESILNVDYGNYFMRGIVLL